MRRYRYESPGIDYLKWWARLSTVWYHMSYQPINGERITWMDYRGVS